MLVSPQVVKDCYDILLQLSPFTPSTVAPEAYFIMFIIVQITQLSHIAVRCFLTLKCACVSAFDLWDYIVVTLLILSYVLRGVNFHREACKTSSSKQPKSGRRTCCFCDKTSQNFPVLLQHHDRNKLLAFCF